MDERRLGFRLTTEADAPPQYRADIRMARGRFLVVHVNGLERAPDHVPWDAPP